MDRRPVSPIESLVLFIILIIGMIYIPAGVILMIIYMMALNKNPGENHDNDIRRQ